MKRVNKKGAGLLMDGEHYIAVAPIQPVGTAVIAAKSGQPGFGASLAAKKIANEWKYPIPGSTAEEFPGRPCLMALTNQRVICIETPRYGRGLKGIMAQWPLGQVVGLDIEKKPVAFGAEIRFADGSTAYMETLPRAKSELLAAALSQ